MILQAVIIGIVAWVFVMILMEEGMIFSWWWEVINRLPRWLAKPLGECEYCLGGQLSLWYYLLLNWHNYNIFYHIAYISLTLFTIKLINTFIYGLEAD